MPYDRSSPYESTVLEDREKWWALLAGCLESTITVDREMLLHLVSWAFNPLDADSVGVGINMDAVAVSLDDFTRKLSEDQIDHLITGLNQYRDASRRLPDGT